MSRASRRGARPRIGARAAVRYGSGLIPRLVPRPDALIPRLDLGSEREPENTDVMSWARRRYRWMAWIAIYGLIGLLTFPLEAPGATALPVQVAGYLAAGIAMLVVAVLDCKPGTVRYRRQLLPVILCAMAAAAGLAAT